MLESPQAYTVSAITRRIKDGLEAAFAGIWVEGEISDYHHHTSGHRYLTLKDARAVLKAVVWRSVGDRLKFEPEPGQKIRAFGDITVYEKGGIYQLNCRRLEPIGVGALELAFRQLYEKLAKEGLFADARKQPLPPYPGRIGVVTSPTGAAVRDIIQVARRRNPGVELLIYPAQVQGDGAEQTLAAGVNYFNTRDDVDLLIIGRGGGSIEDLWAFNTELVVRAIAASQLPVVSAVGHEVDLTLSDLSADLRAPTPSAAAELTVWSGREYKERIAALVRRQAVLLGVRLTAEKQRLRAVLRRPALARPLEPLAQRRQRLDETLTGLTAAARNSLERHRNRLSLALARLEALSPLGILARGYSITRSLPDRGLIRSVDGATPDLKIETVLIDGRVISTVEEITREPGFGTKTKDP